jgi:hypothetical protein
LFFLAPIHAQDAERIRVLGQRIVADLSDINRYDGDISVHAGAWIGRVVHLRLDAAEVAEVILLSFNPRLPSQLSDFLESSSREQQGSSVEFREYRFPVETCAGLSVRIEDLKAALRDSVDSIGQESKKSSPLQEIIVDGRLYELEIRVNRHSEGAFRVGENDQRLFGPLDAVVRAVETCSRGVQSQRRSYGFQPAL